MSMITATAWVSRGYAAPFPTRYVLDDEELDRISKLAKLELNDAKVKLAEAQSAETNSQTEIDGRNSEEGIAESDPTL